jgi:hypothetical protein
VTRVPPGPSPQPPSGDSNAKAGHRPHREPGEAIAGHHADRPGDARSGPSQAGLAWAAGGSHDYTHRGPAPLPAWYYVLLGKPVPDDAPRTPPPPGFGALLAKRRGASPDSASGQMVAAGRPGTGQAIPDDTTAPAPPAAEAAPEPARRRQRRPRPARPAPASTPGPAPPAEPTPPPAATAQWCGKCGYRTDAPGHKMTCLGQT